MHCPKTEKLAKKTESSDLPAAGVDSMAVCVCVCARARVCVCVCVCDVQCAAGAAEHVMADEMHRDTTRQLLLQLSTHHKQLAVSIH